MIKFFRKIRQKLLSQNRVTKYLAYAIGEIFLVVIGILIALQINNWNEKRKQNHSIRLTVQSLIEDFKQDTIQLKLDIKGIEEDLKMLEGIRTRLSQPTSTIDTLKHIARYEYIPFFDPSNEMNRNTIVSILNTGIIEYFDHGLKAKILKFNADQLKSIKIMDENVSIYLNTQGSFGLGIASQSGHPNSMIASVTVDGPLSEQYWSSIDERQFLQSMLNTLSGKMVMNKIILLTKNDLLNKTKEMLTYLQKISD
jgi:hypothetical protein